MAKTTVSKAPDFLYVVESDGIELRMFTKPRPLADFLIDDLLARTFSQWDFEMESENGRILKYGWHKAGADITDQVKLFLDAVDVPAQHPKDREWQRQACRDLAEKLTSLT